LRDHRCGPDATRFRPYRFWTINLASRSVASLLSSSGSIALTINRYPAIPEQDVQLIGHTSDVVGCVSHTLYRLGRLPGLLELAPDILERDSIGSLAELGPGAPQENGTGNRRSELTPGRRVIRFVRARGAGNVVGGTCERFGNLALPGALTQDLSRDLQRERFARLHDVRDVSPGLSARFDVCRLPVRVARARKHGHAADHGDGTHYLRCQVDRHGRLLPGSRHEVTTIRGYELVPARSR